jgi:hypothetical protein
MNKERRKDVAQAKRRDALKDERRDKKKAALGKEPRLERVWVLQNL